MERQAAHRSSVLPRWNGPTLRPAEGKNYPYVRAFRGEPDFEAIAILMLTALHDTYAARHL